jgi:hypothetical protein
MPPMQFAQSPSMPQQLTALSKGLSGFKPGIQNLQNQFSPIGGAVPGAQGPTSVGGPQGPQPLQAPGTPGQTPSITDAIKGLTPPQILSLLQNTSSPNLTPALMASAQPQPIPGPQALAQATPQAGMLPPDMMDGYGGGSA